ncbi:hypothetical protein AB0N06_18525 [Streptomyces sp. NPDC051020]|uniref:hypothetical protein n=1 Tax=Streptomyces sp. NPDC051020 TaxID=3155409 RepID=UPI00342086BD
MKPAAPVGTARSPRSLCAATAAATPCLLMAVVPVVTLGVFGMVPSFVLALRRRGRADWRACAVFTALSVAWMLRIAFTPDETHGFGFAVDLLLLLATTLGAAVHTLLAWPVRARAGHPAREVR